MAPTAFAAIGDEFTAVRGDQSPGLSYSSFIATTSGRWIASGPGGRLMISDDSGANWRYDVIVDGSGKPLNGNVTDLIQIGGSIVGTAVSLTPSSNRFGIPFEGKTQIVSSIDNGNTWQISAFPIREAVAQFGRFPGIFLPNLFVTPGGELIAYGTTVLSNGFGGFFIGGLIFRQTGSTWQQMFFELGMVQSMSQTGSRLAASGFQTVLDSADGGGWNGYRLADAQITVDGEVLDFAIREGLNGSDITYLNDNYVMQTQLFRRSESNPGIFEATAVRNFILESPNPFDGGRIWTGTELNRIYPDWLNLGGQVVSVGRDGAQISSSGADWLVADDTVRSGFGSVGPQGSQTVVSVGNSDEVWRSDNRGQSWTKILDQDPGPDMIQLVRIGNQILGREGNARIWSSVDNGATWVQIADIREQTGRSGITQIRVSGDRLFAAQGETDQIITSSDQGATWEVLTYPRSATTSATLLDVVVGQGERLIIAPESRGINPPETEFFTSDDNGQSWTPRIAPLGFGATPKTGIHAGGGRIIYLMNGFASFDPELVISDDNGVTWRRENPFENLQGLGTPSNDPSQTIIELVQILKAQSGRLIIRGDRGEILTSDDRGDTWVVRENRDSESLDDAFFDWTVFPIVEAGGRLIAPGSRRAGNGSFDDIPIIWISADDGTTWRTFPLDTGQSNTTLFWSAVSPDGRVVLAGNNGAVFVSEAPDLFDERQAVAIVREGETLSLDVPRPPLDGAITVSYKLTPGTATEGEDYISVAGELTWSENDMSPKILTVDTVDNNVFEPPEEFLIELGTDGDLIVAYNYTVEIRDNAPSALAGIEPLTVGPLTTQENGLVQTFRLVLSREPTNNVTISLDNDNPQEVSAQPASFTFTPSNWNIPQTVELTGQDDAVCDLNVAVALTLTPTSEDDAYNDLFPVTVYVTNLDDDQPLFGDGFEAESGGICR
ncbi:MAG: Calx-beta domain-containing protein [Lysobacterales bacterium]